MQTSPRISLPTDAQTRQRMEAIHWHQEQNDTSWEVWRSNDEAHVVTLFADDPPLIHGCWERLTPVLTVLGVTPPGYRLVPEDVAQKGLPLIERAVLHAQARAEQAKEFQAIFAPDADAQGKTSLAKNVTETAQDLEEWKAIAAALTGAGTGIVSPTRQEALAVLDRWLKSMDNPETEPPLEVHHADIDTIRAALSGVKEETKKDG